MPTYVWVCEKGHRFDRYTSVDSRNDPQNCDCGESARRIITLPMVHVKPDVHYESPIDGKPITSMAARKDDLARSGCIEYDPEMKTDYMRRIARNDADLEKAVSETVDREIANMPSRKREKLESEMAGGMDLTPERYTPSAKPIVTEVHNG